jgi:hypothetical protein
MCLLTTTLGICVVDMHCWYRNKNMKSNFKRLADRVSVMSFWLFGNSVIGSA